MPVSESAKAAHGDPVVVDLGRKKKKQIKQLRQGQGKLMAEVNSCVQELKDSGTISASAQPVIVIVRERQKGLKSLMLPMLP